MKTTLSSFDRAFGLLLLSFATASVACDSPSSENERSPADSLMSLASSLQGAVSACADAQTSCAAMSGDAGAATCRDAFDACREQAKEAAKPDIDKAVNGCADTIKTCREAATTSEAKAACGETLGGCLGAEKADAGPKDEKPEKADGGQDKESSAPVATCIGALRTCIEGDAPAHDCTDALRECIASSVGHKGGDGGADKPDQPGKADAGKPVEPGKADAGKPVEHETPDAGKPVDTGKADAGKPVDTGNPDAGKPVDTGKADAGMGDGMMSKACKDAYDACVEAGGTRDECGKALKACRMP